MNNHDNGLITLLELNGTVLVQEKGYWVQIAAWQVTPSSSYPMGIRYSLSLHDSYGKRVLGYDNAHAVKNLRFFNKVAYEKSFDHKHRHPKDKGIPYQFDNAYRLLEDFFTDVDQYLKGIKR
jgi:hypothetical protein